MQNRPEVKVDSSNIDTLSLTDRILRVKFKSGSAYIYQNVSPELFDEIVAGASVGRTFNQLIKSNPVDYPCLRADAH